MHPANECAMTFGELMKKLRIGTDWCNIHDLVPLVQCYSDGWRIARPRHRRRGAGGVAQTLAKSLVCAKSMPRCALVLAIAAVSLSIAINARPLSIPKQVVKSRKKSQLVRHHFTTANLQDRSLALSLSLR